jgi:hypothetical protein
MTAKKREEFESRASVRVSRRSARRAGALLGTMMMMFAGYGSVASDLSVSFQLCINDRIVIAINARPKASESAESQRSRCSPAK